MESQHGPPMCLCWNMVVLVSNLRWLSENTCQKQLPAAPCAASALRAVRGNSKSSHTDLSLHWGFFSSCFFSVPTSWFQFLPLLNREIEPFSGDLSLFHAQEEVGVYFSELIWPMCDPFLSRTQSLNLDKGSWVSLPGWIAYNLLNKPENHLLWFGEKHRFTQPQGLMMRKSGSWILEYFWCKAGTTGPMSESAGVTEPPFPQLWRPPSSLTTSYGPLWRLPLLTPNWSLSNTSYPVSIILSGKKKSISMSLNIEKNLKQLIILAKNIKRKHIMTY